MNLNKPVGSIWTDEQWNAIFKDNANIIVSAGAGSGKTAVLTERVIFKLKNKVHINELIILTFTNAAAFEMKERIRAKIKKDSSLKKELDILDEAYITTFDGFALNVLKKYHYLLNIDKNINIIDNVYLEIIKHEFLDDIFKNSYKDPSFLNFINTYTVKDDLKIKNIIMNLYNKLSNILSKEEYLKSYITTYYSDVFIEEKLLEYKNIIKENINELFNIINELNSLSDNIIVKEIENSLLGLKSENYEILNYYKLPNIPFKKNDSFYDQARSLYDKLKERLNYIKELTTNSTEFKFDILKTLDSAQVIVDLLLKFDKKLLDFKFKNSLFEFSDIMQNVIKIFKEFPKVKEEYQDTIKEIMVDEFQDTNDINWELVNLISKNNLYLVGDIKQSIYRFRNANPKIFSNVYNQYSTDGITIDLNKNFRSRKEVLDSINLIFSHIMDEYLGGVNYDTKQKLEFGNTSYLDNKNNNNLEILSYEIEDKKYSKEEREAFIIASDIIDKVSSKYLIYDFKTSGLREVKYSDFVILIDRKGSFDLYKKIFEYKNIPLTVHKETDFSYNSLMYALKNLFKLISLYKENTNETKYAFISVARSFILELSDDLIFKNIDNFYGEFKEFFSIIEYLNNYKNTNSLSALVLETYKKFDLYLKIIKIGNVRENTLKLDYLLSKAKELENLGYNIQEFINYFELMNEYKTDISFKPVLENNNNTVNIMSIHASKGLEFPICYYSSLFKKFSTTDLKENFIFDKKYGFIIPIFKEGLADTIYKKLYELNYIKEDISERLRLLYVALTRAKEKIILLLPNEELNEYKFDDNLLVSKLERLDYNSFSAIFKSINKYLKSFIKEVNVFPSKDYEFERKLNINEKVEKQDFIIDTYEISINKNIVSKTNYSSIFSGENKDALLGIKIHEVLEYLDYNNFEEDLKKYDISNDTKEKIVKLFKMPFMENIKSSKIYKEFQFINDNIGVIDLLIENDKFIVVDFKTKNIDKLEYKKQVIEYVKYIKTITNKEVEGYIYSVIDSIYIKVNERD